MYILLCPRFPDLLFACTSVLEFFLCFVSEVFLGFIVFTSLFSLFYINRAFYTENELKSCITYSFQMQPSQEHLKTLVEGSKKSVLWGILK